MFSYKLGSWTLEFDRKINVIENQTSAVVIDEKRRFLVLLSLKGKETICVERIYYDLRYFIYPLEKRITFQIVDDIIVNG